MGRSRPRRPRRACSITQRRSSPTRSPAASGGRLPPGRRRPPGPYARHRVFPANGTSETCTSNRPVRGRRPTTRNRPRRRTVPCPAAIRPPVSSGHYYGFSFFVSPGAPAWLTSRWTPASARRRFVPKQRCNQIAIPKVASRPMGRSRARAAKQWCLRQRHRPSSPTPLPGISKGATPSRA